MEWINQNEKKEAIVVITANWSLYSAKPFAEPHLTTIDRGKLKKMKLEEPDYYLYNTRFSFKWHEFFPSCDVVHVVTRKGVPLTTVKDCQVRSVESN